MHARFLGVSRHVITIIPALFSSPTSSTRFQSGNRSRLVKRRHINSTFGHKGEGVQNAKNSRNTSFFGKTAVQVGCTGAVVQHGPKSQGRAFETPKDFWICIRINPYINPYKE